MLRQKKLPFGFVISEISLLLTLVHGYFFFPAQHNSSSWLKYSFIFAYSFQLGCSISLVELQYS